ERRARPRAGRCATSRAGTPSSPSGERRPRLREARSAGGAARPTGGARAPRDGARGCSRAVARRGAAEGTRRARPLGDRRHPRPPGRRAARETAGPRDPRGAVARVEPYRYADAYQLAAVDRPLLAVLDRVTDPRNLGAVCRSAEGAGATGVVVPAHGSAVVTPAVARASAGAVAPLPVAVRANPPLSP